MREITEDIWEYPAEAIVIPTNTTLKPSGDIDIAVMGAGLALQAAQRYPTLPYWLGRRITLYGGDHVYVFDDIDMVERDGHYVVCLPTKHHWRDPSDLVLIETMVGELVPVVYAMSWSEVAIPRLGCGRGGLNWERQVRPLLKRMLDDSFVVVSKD